jgi:hypothetical protein
MMSVEETWNIYKPSRLEHLLSLLECRFAIAMVDGRTVRSNYAKVQIVQWSTTEFSFFSSLDLPVDRSMRLAFELILSSELIHMTGRLTRKQSTGQGIYGYQVSYELTPSSRSLLLSGVHRLLDHDVELAMQLYTLFSDPEPVPALIDIQT